jgi:hypothetical protein
LYNGKSQACRTFKEYGEKKKTDKLTVNIPPLKKLKADKAGVDIPWLFYKTEDTKAILSSEIELTVAFYNRYKVQSNTRTEYLTYFILQYNMDGTLKGKQEIILKNHINACPMSYDAVTKSRRFGVVTFQQCEFELNDLIDPKRQRE